MICAPWGSSNRDLMPEHVQKILASPCGSLPRLPEVCFFNKPKGDEHLPKIALPSELDKMSYSFSVNSQGKRNRDMRSSFWIIPLFSEILSSIGGERGGVIEKNLLNANYSVPITVLVVLYILHVFSNLTSRSAIIGGIIPFY